MKAKIFKGLKKNQPNTVRQKIYFNCKTNELVIETEGIDIKTYEPYYSKVSKQIPMNETTDTYIGVALLIAQTLFGSNTKYREWVDSWFVGKRPEEIYQASAEAIHEYELETILGALCTAQIERKFEVGQRVLFLNSKEQRESMGIIVGFNDDGTYNVEFNNEIISNVNNNQIIRKCRKPNKKKEKNNGRK